MTKTQKRRDKHSTEFGLWLREQPELDSYKGYNTSNVDFMWMNERLVQWLFVEETGLVCEDTTCTTTCI